MTFYKTIFNYNQVWFDKGSLRDFKLTGLDLYYKNFNAVSTIEYFYNGKAFYE